MVKFLFSGKFIFLLFRAIIIRPSVNFFPVTARGIFSKLDVYKRQAEGHSAAEIHRRLCNVYGKNVMTDGSVREWCRKFEEG